MSGFFAPSGNALVTGAASGIGKAIAVAYAKAGASGVYLVDLDTVHLRRAVAEAKEAATNPKFIAHGGVHDVSDEHAVAEMIKRFKELFGRLDYACNFAGITELPDSVESIKLEVYDHILATNARGVLLCTKAELQVMEQQQAVTTLVDRVAQKGAIVNAASIGSFVVIQGSVAYTVSKHAVLGITRAAASAYNNTSGIRVNCVCPGFIETPIVVNLPLADKEAVEALAAGQRLGQPEEVADVVVFLNSANASFVNGQSWIVDNEKLSTIIPNA